MVADSVVAIPTPSPSDTHCPPDQDRTTTISLNDVEGDRRRADIDECGDQTDQEGVGDGLELLEGSVSSSSVEVLPGFYSLRGRLTDAAILSVRSESRGRQSPSREERWDVLPTLTYCCRRLPDTSVGTPAHIFRVRRFDSRDLTVVAVFVPSLHWHGEVAETTWVGGSSGRKPMLIPSGVPERGPRACLVGNAFMGPVCLVPFQWTCPATPCRAHA